MCLLPKLSIQTKDEERNSYESRHIQNEYITGGE